DNSLEFEEELKLPPGLRILTTNNNSIFGQQQDLSLQLLSTATGENLAVSNIQTSTPVDLPNKADLIMTGTFSGQSKEILTAAIDGSLTLRSMEIAPVSQFKKLESGYVIKLGCDFHGRYWVAGTTAGGLFVLDREHPDERKWLIETSSQSHRVAPRFSPDHKSILTLNNSKTIQSRRLESGLPDHRYEIMNFKESSGVSDVTTLLAGSEQNVYCGTSSGTIEMLSDDTSTPSIHFFASDSAITAMAESPDRQVLLVGDENGKAIWFDLQQSDEKGTLQEQAVRIWSIDFSSNSQRAATASEDHTVIVWEAANRTKQFVLNGHKDAVQVVKFSPNDRWLVSGDRSGQLRLWDMDEGKSVWNDTIGENLVQLQGIPMHAPRESYQEYFPDLGITSVAFSSNQRVLAAGTATGYLQTFDLYNFRELSVVYVGRPITDLKFTEDGTALLVATLTGDVERYWQNLDPPSMLPGHEGQVRFAALDSKGNKAVTGGHDRHLCVWDVDQKTLVASIENDGEGIAAGALSPDGNRAVTAGFGSGVVFWDLDQMRRIEKRYGHQGRVWCLAFTRDGSRVASGSDDKTVKVWDFATRKNTLTISHENSVRFVTFSPDGKQLLTSTVDERGWKYPADLQLWDSSTGSLLKKFNGHRVNVTGACFNADGTEIISCGADGQICRWNVSSGNCLQDLTRQNGVYNPSLINDDQLLITKRFGNGIFIDEAKSLNRLAEFSVPTQSVDDLNVSSDGIRIIAATKEGRVYVWSIGDE
ncbi:WD40 repeat domain-containing protein, partial [uncultured Rubinisphaera sp.]|uniref:WD40 repeat domain-containing protein n=1 Tax=uncultured Rubinisphaera sp. TaxID=1678686 RepID=UPI0030D7F07C